MHCSIRPGSGPGTLERQKLAFLPKEIIYCDPRKLAGQSISRLLEDSDNSISVRHVENVSEIRVERHSNIGLLVFSIDPLSLGESARDELSQFALAFPTVPIALFVRSVGDDIVRLLRPVEIRGIMSEYESPEIVGAAIKLILAGGLYSSFLTHSAANSQAISEASPSSHADKFARSLKISDKEMLVLAELMAGRSNKQIAKTLEIAENTVKIHMRSIMRKFGAQNRTEVVSLFQGMRTAAQ